MVGKTICGEAMERDTRKSTEVENRKGEAEEPQPTTRGHKPRGDRARPWREKRQKRRTRERERDKVPLCATLWTKHPLAPA